MLGILTYCAAAFIELHFLNAICFDAMHQFQHCAEILNGSFLLDLPFEYQKSVSPCIYDVDTISLLMISIPFQVDMFLIQIANHPLKITAHGLFRLDNALTFSVSVHFWSPLINNLRI